MEKILKTINTGAILFFSYIKWPYFLAYPIVYNYGFETNIYLEIFWFISMGLIAVDIYKKYQEEKAREEAQEPKE